MHVEQGLTIPDLTVYESLFGSLTEDDLDRVAIVEGSGGAETTYRQLRAER